MGLVKSGLASLTLVAGSLLANGCTSYSNYNNDDIYTIRFSDFGNPNKMSTPVESFGRRETPTVIVKGYQGKTVSVDILDISKGKELDNFTTYIPTSEGGAYYTLPGLPESSYQLLLSTHGSVRDTWLFTISR